MDLWKVYCSDMRKICLAMLVCALLGVLLSNAYKNPSISQARVSEVKSIQKPAPQAVLEFAPVMKIHSKHGVAESTNSVSPIAKTSSPQTTQTSERILEFSKDSGSQTDVTKGLQMKVDQDWGMKVKVDSRPASDFSRREEASKDRLESVGPSVSMERKF